MPYVLAGVLLHQPSDRARASGARGLRPGDDPAGPVDPAPVSVGAARCREPGGSAGGAGRAVDPAPVPLQCTGEQARGGRQLPEEAARRRAGRVRGAVHHQRPARSGRPVPAHGDARAAHPEGDPPSQLVHRDYGHASRGREQPRRSGAAARDPHPRRDGDDGGGLDFCLGRRRRQLRLQPAEHLPDSDADAVLLERADQPSSRRVCLAGRLRRRLRHRGRLRHAHH